LASRAASSSDRSRDASAASAASAPPPSLAPRFAAARSGAPDHGYHDGEQREREDDHEELH